MTNSNWLNGRSIACALALALPIILSASPVFTGQLGIGTSPITFTPVPNEVQIGASVINSANFHDYTDYAPIALQWALSMSSTDNTVTPDIFMLSGGTSGNILMPNGETITFGLADGKIVNGNFTPIGGPSDSITGTLTWTTYGPDGGSGTILNGIVSVTGNADPSGFFSSLGLRSGFPGGTLALSLDVTCTSGASAVPCIAASDPSGTVTSTALTPAPSGVPEPGTITMLGCGLAAILVWRQRREAARHSA